MANEYKVSDVMVTQVVTGISEQKIRDVAKLMAEKEIGSVVITDGLSPVGILTEQDIARKVVARSVDPDTTPVSEVMSKKLMTAWPNMDLNQAIELMGKNLIKHLPVVQDSQLVGMVSLKDIIAIQPDLIELAAFKSNKP